MHKFVKILICKIFFLFICQAFNLKGMTKILFKAYRKTQIFYVVEREGVFIIQILLT